MEVMTLNCGSSSVKYSFWDMPAKKKLCHGIVDGIGENKSIVTHYKSDQHKSVQTHDCLNHSAAIGVIFDILTDPEEGVVNDLIEIDAVGHRVAHGGEKFTSSIIVNDEVIREIERFTELAPLHNPPNLDGIRAVMKLMPAVPNVAIFDTAFLTTMPPHVFIYAVPYEWYEKYGIRKYGYHGTSHFYVSTRAAALLKKSPVEVNILTLHIGSGVSVTAVKKGEAYDHSMGFGTLEGAVMGTRCGHLDPVIPLYIMKKAKLSSDEVEDILYRKSGLLGITGRFTDRREILEASEAGDELARLAFDIECYRLRKYIGEYAAGMGGIDAIVFTAGVGENSFQHRLKICEGLEFMGIKIDEEANKRAVGVTEEAEISTPDSRVKVFVIPTNEEQVFAEDTYRVLSG